jgi:ABC-type transport system involved in multi-copper enzyme maturation permease subunit
MIGLVRSEILKLRKRWATYIVPLIGIVLMALVYLLVRTAARGPGVDLITRFPAAYGFINQFVFGLGSLLALAYSAAIGGADWSWGIMRVVIARGEGRGRYVIGKAIGLAIVLFLGSMVVLAFGILLTLASAAIAHGSAGNPVSGDSFETLLRSIAYGTLVLWERCFIGFAVAFLLRSQLAGVVVGIVLYIGEGLLSTILTVLTISSAEGRGIGTITTTQWYQYLPFNIGSQLLGHAASIPGQDISSIALEPVPLEQALAGVVGYLVLAIAIAVIVTKRAEIRG